MIFVLNALKSNSKALVRNYGAKKPPNVKKSYDQED
jgi:hypothetical protein